MTLQRVPRPTIRFVAVSEETSDRWFALVLGFVLGLPVIALGVVLGLMRQGAG